MARSRSAIDAAAICRARGTRGADQAVAFDNSGNACMAGLAFNPGDAHASLGRDAHLKWKFCASPLMEGPVPWRFRH